jgi:hypothetical protein
MATFMNEAYGHELIHYSQGIQIHQQLGLNKWYESVTSFAAADGTIPPETEKGFYRGTTLFNRAIKANDIAIDANAATAFTTSITCAWRF